MLGSVAGLGREKDLSLFPISAAGWTVIHSFVLLKSLKFLLCESVGERIMKSRHGPCCHALCFIV